MRPIDDEKYDAPTAPPGAGEYSYTDYCELAARRYVSRRPPPTADDECRAALPTLVEHLLHAAV